MAAATLTLPPIPQPHLIACLAPRKNQRIPRKNALRDAIGNTRKTYETSAYRKEGNVLYLPPQSRLPGPTLHNLLLLLSRHHLCQHNPVPRQPDLPALPTSWSLVNPSVLQMGPTESLNALQSLAPALEV